MTKRHLLKGESVLANQTVRIDGRTAMIKNRTYLIKATKYSCCQQTVDIGYVHPKPIVRACAHCGKKAKAAKRVLIPSSYFRRRGEKIDHLEQQLMGLQKLFSRLNAE